MGPAGVVRFCSWSVLIPPLSVTTHKVREWLRTTHPAVGGWLLGVILPRPTVGDCGQVLSVPLTVSKEEQ